MLQAIRDATFISILLGVPSTLGQRPESTAPPDFHVHITAQRAFLYSDEGVGFEVMIRANKKVSPNCDLGSSTTVQVLRNGNVIKSFKSGPVSMLGHKTVRGVQYVYYSWGLGPDSFFDSARPFQIGREETFQLRAICGDEVSEPSKQFHITEWREPVDGLQVLVTPLQKTYKVGEPIRVKVTMRNIGRSSKLCPVPFPEDGFLRSFWALKPYWVDERPAKDDKLLYTRSLRTLRSGESRTAVFVLNGYKGTGRNKTRSLGAEPGKYLVWFAVFFDDDQVPAKYRKNLWRDHDLSSNDFEIVIE